MKEPAGAAFHYMASVQAGLVEWVTNDSEDDEDDDGR